MVIPREDMYGLKEVEKINTKSFLDDFKEIFALKNGDFGCAQDKFHKLYVVNALIFSTHLQTFAKSNKLIAD